MGRRKSIADWENEWAAKDAAPDERFVRPVKRTRADTQAVLDPRSEIYSVKSADPGLPEYLDSLKGAALEGLRTGNNARDLGAYLGQKGRQYLDSHTGGEALDGLKALAAKAGNAILQSRHGVGPIADFAVNAIQHPADLLPFSSTVHTIDDAAHMRAAGQTQVAGLLDKMAVPSAVVDAASMGVLGKLASPAKQAATRPLYDIAAEQPFKTVARQGVENEIVRMPEAANANMGELRALAQDRARSPAIRVADDASMAARGVPYDESMAVPRSSLRRQAGIGRAYREAATGNPEYKHAVFEAYGNAMPEVVERAKAQNYDQLTEAAYRSLGDEVAQQFDRLPVKFRYHEGAGEYPSSTDMARDVLANGNLNVFSGGDPHEFLSQIDPATGLSQNEMFRGVHDYLGHVVPGSMFGPQGEEAAYAAHSQMLSPLAQMALLSETRGQNSLVNYSPLNADLIGEKNALRRMMQERALGERYMAENPDSSNNFEIRRALEHAPSREDILKLQQELGARFSYAPQKALLLPPEYLSAGSEGGMPDYLRGVLSGKAPTEARGVHFSRSDDLTTTDPSRYGTGAPSGERAMVRREGNPERTYFYSGPQGEVWAEDPVKRGVKGVYEADLNNLYDLQRDPEGLVDLAKAHNLTDYKPLLPYNVARAQFDPGSPIPDIERLARDYGYSGYITDFSNQRAAAVYDPVTGLRKIGTDPNLRYAAGGLVE